MVAVCAGAAPARGDERASLSGVSGAALDEGELGDSTAAEPAAAQGREAAAEAGPSSEAAKLLSVLDKLEALEKKRQQAVVS